MSLSNDFLKINQLVNIELSHDNKQVRRFASRVENLVLDETAKEYLIYLATPIQDRIPVFIPPGSALNICFWDTTALFSLSGIVVDNIVDNLHQTIFKTSTNMLKRTQNRQFVRADYLLDVAVTYRNGDGEKWTLDSQSKDLSGGGISLVLPDVQIPFKEESIIGLQFIVDNIPFDVIGTVIWLNREMDCQMTKKLIVGINFTAVSEEVRKLIIRAVYSRQIELRRLIKLEESAKE